MTYIVRVGLLKEGLYMLLVVCCCAFSTCLIISKLAEWPRHKYVIYWEFGTKLNVKSIIIYLTYLTVNLTGVSKCP